MRIRDWSSDLCSSDLAPVVELVDATDSKSVARKGVLVQVRPGAPPLPLYASVEIPVLPHVGQQGGACRLPAEGGTRPGAGRRAEVGRASGTGRGGQYG